MDTYYGATMDSGLSTHFYDVNLSRFVVLKLSVKKCSSIEEMRCLRGPRFSSILFMNFTKLRFPSSSTPFLISAGSSLCLQMLELFTYTISRGEGSFDLKLRSGGGEKAGLGVLTPPFGGFFSGTLTWNCPLYRVESNLGIISLALAMSGTLRSLWTYFDSISSLMSCSSFEAHLGDGVVSFRSP